MGKAYLGSKATAGLCQPLIGMMPPHHVYIETHLDGAAIRKRKPLARRNLGMELDAAGQCSQAIPRLGRSRRAWFETVQMLLVARRTLKSPVHSSLSGSLLRPDQTAKSKPRATTPRRQHEQDECGHTRHTETLQESPVEPCPDFDG